MAPAHTNDAPREDSSKGQRWRRTLAIVIYQTHRSVVTVALTVAIGETHGWMRGLMIVATALFIIDNVILSYVSSRRKQAPQPSRPVLVAEEEVLTFSGEEAQQLHELIQAMAAKHHHSDKLQ